MNDEVVIETFLYVPLIIDIEETDILSYDINTGYLLTDDKELELIECNFELVKEMKKTVEKCIKLLEKVFNSKLQSCGSVSFLGGTLEVDRLLLSVEERGEDVDYIPVVMEFKRIDNRDLRRRVLAQLLEYMTAIHLDPRKVIEACKESGVDFDIDNLKKNIEERHIRGVILSEEIPEIVEKTIEFLNEELSNLEIYGIELKRLCSSDKEHKVIIPVNRCYNRGRKKEKEN